jgi:hypothetical protein
MCDSAAPRCHSLRHRTQGLPRLPYNVRRWRLTVCIRGTGWSLRHAAVAAAAERRAAAGRRISAEVLRAGAKHNRAHGFMLLVVRAFVLDGIHV